MRHLNTIYLDSNLLTGTLPSFNNRALQTIAFSNNSLTGTIPWMQFKLNLSTEVYLNNNFLTGTIPEGLSKYYMVELLPANIICVFYDS